MSSLGGKVAAFAAAWFVSGCTCSNTIDPEGHVCDTGGICPSGYVCVANVCHSTGGTGGGSGGGKGGGNGGNGGGNDNCNGVVCNMPPQAMCVMASTLRTYSGVCNPAKGDCDYTPTDSQCPNGCTNGVCNGNTCVGVTCNAPPSPTCRQNKVITSSLPGNCDMGTCRYSENEMSCGAMQCANGACVPTGTTFAQVLPRVRHQVTAVDQQPNRLGDDVVVVGPNASVSRWDGTRWTQIPATGGMTGNLNAIWYASATNAYIVAEGGFFRLTGSTITRITGFPATDGGSKLIDVHGLSDTNMVVVDATGTAYRYQTNAWLKFVPDAGQDPYTMSGVFMSSDNRVRYFGKCGKPISGGCVRYQDSLQWYDDVDTATANFTAAGAAIDPVVMPPYAWLGLDIPAIRSHANDGDFASTGTPTGMDGGAVVAITGTAPLAITRATYVLTAPTLTTLGHLYRVSGLAVAPGVEHLMEVFYGHQALSKTESSGVIVVDTDTVFLGSTITRRSNLVTEVLDLGAESWVAGSSMTNGSVLVNAYGDVALRTTGAATFQLRRFPTDLTATDIAGGNTFSVFTAGDGTAQKLTHATGAFSPVSFMPSAPASLAGVCRVSDSEWYLVGKGGAIYAYDGTTARSMTSTTGNSLSDVDCPSAGNAVACGGGSVLRLQGTTWSSIANPPANVSQCRLVGGAVYVAGPNVYARFLNGQWTTFASRATLDGLVVKSVNEAYAASGTQVFRFDGSAWTSVATAPQNLVAGFLMGSRVVFAGNGGVVLEGQ